jgi:CHAD domain-containing protein
MSIRLPADLLRRSVEEGSRLLALGYLDEIGLAERRLPDPQDSEALHDFRVGLRRLRSCIRAYRPRLKGSVSRKLRRRLGDLTVATNPGRDLEVQLEWLHQQLSRLGPGETEGMAWLTGRLEGRKYESMDQVTADIGKRFLKTARKLRPRLGTFQMEVRTGKEPKPASFGEVTGSLIQSLAGELADSLEAVSNPEQIAEAHEARIRAKRLRYLLEPLSRRVAGAKTLVGRLKQLQDLLGRVHDLQVLVGEIDSSLAALSKGTPDRPLAARPGLEALRKLAEQDAGVSFARFQAEWSPDRALRFRIRADELGRRLTGDTPTDSEPGPGTAGLREGNGKPASNGQGSGRGLPVYAQSVGDR